MALHNQISATAKECADGQTGLHYPLKSVCYLIVVEPELFYPVKRLQVVG
jgi:hypothetical protein